MPYRPIPCDIHDYLEIACMANIELRLTLRSGETLKVSPVTTRVADRAEWLVCQQGGTSERIRLDQIQWFEPTQNSTLFERVVLP